MKALVIGFGKMGMLHASTLRMLGVEELVISDPSKIVQDALKKMCPHFRVYGHYEEALSRESSIDAAVLAAPTHLHHTILSRLITQHIPTFTEKPLVTDSTEATSIYDQYRALPSQMPLMTGFCLRFLPTYLAAKSYLDEGAIGKLLHFEAKMYSSDVMQRERGWRFEQGGKGYGVSLDLGSHLVDLVRFLFGMPERVSGRTERWYSSGVDDFFTATFFYSSFDGLLEACWSIPGIRKPTPEIHLVGEFGTLFVSNDEVTLALFKDRPHRKSGIYKKEITSFADAVPFDLAGSFYTRQSEEFLGAVQGGKAYRNTLIESIQNHRLIDAARQASGQMIELGARSL